MEESKKDNKSVRQSSISCEKRSTFDESDLFRRKKKPILKERLKTEQLSKTPIHKKCNQNSPTT